MTSPGRACRAGTAGALLVLTLLAGGCSSRVPAPLTAPPVVDARDRHVRALQRDLAVQLDVPALHRGVSAVVVRSADRGDTLFRYHDDLLVMPASNMKIVTLAAAVERLGWDYTFTTTFSAAGPILEGTIEGDVVVTGNGDPTIGGREEPASAVMDRWARALWQKGLRRIAGRLIGDDRAFAGEGLGSGWAWDDLGWGYSAPVGALQANAATAEVRIVPGSREGEPAAATLTPVESGLELDAAVSTGPATSPVDIELFRRPGSPALQARGVVPIGAAPFVRTVAIDRPTHYFLQLLEAALVRRGISVRDGVAPVSTLPAGEWPAGAQPMLLQHTSPPLRSIAGTLMKASQNLYAETLLRAIAAADGAAGTSDGGVDAVRRVLAAWGISPDTLVMVDGSGLSRYNYVTAGTLSTILDRMYRDPARRQPWLDALAVGGIDGTLEKRFKGTAGEGLVRGKTGLLSNTRALSGYVPSADGEMLSFVIVFNNVTERRQALDAIADGIVLRLMRFAR